MIIRKLVDIILADETITTQDILKLIFWSNRIVCSRYHCLLKKGDSCADGTGQSFRNSISFSFSISRISFCPPLHNTCSFFLLPLCIADTLFHFFRSKSFTPLASSKLAPNMSLKVGQYWVICYTYQMIIQDCHHVSMTAGLPYAHTILFALSECSLCNIFCILNWMWKCWIISKRCDTVSLMPLHGMC